MGWTQGRLERTNLANLASGLGESPKIFVAPSYREASLEQGHASRKATPAAIVSEISARGRWQDGGAASLPSAGSE
jgi:hypothetical protein